MPQFAKHKFYMFNCYTIDALIYENYTTTPNNFNFLISP